VAFATGWRDAVRAEPPNLPGRPRRGVERVGGAWNGSAGCGPAAGRGPHASRVDSAAGSRGGAAGSGMAGAGPRVRGLSSAAGAAGAAVRPPVGVRSSPNRAGRGSSRPAAAGAPKPPRLDRGFAGRSGRERGGIGCRDYPPDPRPGGARGAGIDLRSDRSASRLTKNEAGPGCPRPSPLRRSDQTAPAAWSPRTPRGRLRRRAAADPRPCPRPAARPPRPRTRPRSRPATSTLRFGSFLGPAASRSACLPPSGPAGPRRIAAAPSRRPPTRGDPGKGKERQEQRPGLAPTCDAVMIRVPTRPSGRGPVSERVPRGGIPGRAA